MRYRLLSLIAAVGLAGCARNSGTIDGRPIPPQIFAVDRSWAGWQRNVCSNLCEVVEREAHESAGRRLSITVTQAELKAAASQIAATTDANLAKTREAEAAITAGLAAVIDRGQDPHSVYEQMFRGLGTPENTWLHMLNSARISPERRKRLERVSMPTPEQMAAANASAAAAIARYKEIDKVVDRRLAADDPQFRAYLDEYNPDATQHPMNVQHSAYLAGARAGFWRDAISKLDIRLADPSWFETCKLADLGAKPPRKRIF
jgi:hypothetical protein